MMLTRVSSFEMKKEVSTLLETLKKNKNKIVICTMIGFVACLFIVQLPYWIGRIKVLIDTDYSASDVLAFLGNYISAIGTIILGWIAIKQTEQANKISDNANRINERVAELEIARHIEEHDPVILIEWVKLHDFSYNKIACKDGFDGKLHHVRAKFEKNVNESRQCIEINLLNTGKSGIHNCKLEKVCYIPEELEKDFSCLGDLDAPFALKAGSEIKFNLFLYPNVVERFAIRELQSIQIMFSCINDYNEKYYLILDIEGAVSHMGNNRYEGLLFPRPHPVNYTFSSKRVADC